ncbi:MAG: DUF1015 domain-containing protein [Solirubrobacterales bacterium]
MAEIKPIRTVRFDTAVAGPLEQLISPPYDVIDDALRAELAGGNSYNVVEIDLPVGDRKYSRAGELIEAWTEAGALTAENEPAFWVLRQNYEGPDGTARTRTGLFCRVRVTDYGPGLIRPHERTHPGPKQDRLDLMRATRMNLSPIFSLFSDASGDFRAAINRVADGEHFDQARDSNGTENSIWRVADSADIATFTAALADRELLIADGHHRYETARAYAAEVGGEGDHNFVLMYVCALEDPGMTVFATHRLAEHTTAEQQAAVGEAIKQNFEVSEVTSDQLAPPENPGVAGEFGYLDAVNKQPYRLRLKDQSIADRALEGFPASYQQLDTAILEALFLKGALGMSDDDISHLNGLWYSSDVEEARNFVETERYDLGFFLRPTPIEQIREIAADGVNMPPKSTYFYPKIPTGLVFNPLY